MILLEGSGGLSNYLHKKDNLGYNLLTKSL